MPGVSEPFTDAPILHWCVGRSKTTSTWSPIHDQSWSAFLQWLKPDQPASSKEVRPYVGGTLVNGRRTAHTVDQRFFLTLDADYADPDFPMEVEILLHDVPYLIHTTWRHTSESHRYRLIIPLSRGVTPNEHKELAWLIMDRLGGEQFDKTTAQAERFMWGPSSPNSHTYFYKSAHARALYLPVDTWLDGTHRPAQSRTEGSGGNTPPGHNARPSEAHSASPTDEDVKRAQEILESAVDDVIHVHERGEFAGRNEAVFHLLPILLRFSQAGALEEDFVLDSLFAAAQQVPSDDPYTRQEFDASVASARKYADEEGPTLPDTTPTKMAIADFAEVEDDSDEEDLWTASPQLRHIAQAADNIGCNRSALLAAVLTRILVQIDPEVLLVGSEDGSVGSRAALNLGVVLVGSSGQGKTTIQEKSDELIPGTSRFEAKPSTGQGLIQAYLEQSPESEELRLKAEPKCLWLFDEIDTLAANAADKTSTLLSEVRTMLTGGMTGTKNATVSRQRHLRKRSYNFQMIVNAQPSRAGVLLNDRDGGTPQRFIWAAVNDPGRVLHVEDRPPWPGPLDWSDVFTLMFAVGEPVVDIPQWLKDELRDYDYKVRQEGIEGGPLSRNSHKNLLRLKVATGIAFLHESHKIEDWHVHMADIVLKSSYRVQRQCEKIIAKTEFDAKLAKVRSESHVVQLVGDEKLKHLTEVAVTKLKRSDDWVPWKNLRPQYQDRSVWEEPLWESLERIGNVETRESEKPYGTEIRKSRKARWVE